MAAAYYIRHFRANPLLQRKQFGILVLHPNRANVPKTEIQEYLATRFKVSDRSCIILYGFSTAFGGGRSTGMGLIYNSQQAAKDVEKKYRLYRSGILKKEDRQARKGRKELKNRKKKVHGKQKSKVSSAGKKGR